MLTWALGKMSRGVACSWQSQEGRREQGTREEDGELCSGCVQLSSCPLGRARGAVDGQQLRELGPEVGGGRGEV